MRATKLMRAIRHRKVPGSLSTDSRKPQARHKVASEACSEEAPNRTDAERLAGVREAVVTVAGSAVSVLRAKYSMQNLFDLKPLLDDLVDHSFGRRLFRAVRNASRSCAQRFALSLCLFASATVR